MKYLTWEDFKKIANSGNNIRHWKYYKHRWEYHQKVIDIVKKININNPDKVLELGSLGATIVKNSHTMDYIKNKNRPQTYIYDAKILPWPIKDKQYELFIALKVYQHLALYQKECFQEAKRIAHKIIIVSPIKYKNKDFPESKCITEEDLINWNDGKEPNETILIGNNVISYWTF